MQKSIEIACENGFQTNPVRREDDLMVHTLNPLFWQCLAKGLSKDSWKTMWRDYTEYLIETGDPEAFFKELLQ